MTLGTHPRRRRTSPTGGTYLVARCRPLVRHCRVAAHRARLMLAGGAVWGNLAEATTEGRTAQRRPSPGEPEDYSGPFHSLATHVTGCRDRPDALVRWTIMNPGGPSDGPSNSGPPSDRGTAIQNAYPADLAGLVLTRWHEAAAAAEIHLPPPATSTLADLLAICYQATLLREEGRPVTFRLALSEPDAFAAGRPAC